MAVALKLILMFATVGLICSVKIGLLLYLISPQKIKKIKMQHRERVCAVSVCVYVLDREGNRVFASRVLEVSAYWQFVGHGDFLTSFRELLLPPCSDSSALVWKMLTM